jgi:methanogenic corrinoid protein MtbC1
MAGRVQTVCDDYLAALLAGDGTRARHLVERALAEGVSPPEVCLQVLQPALVSVGELWERGEVSVAYEHYATAVTSGVLGALAPRMRVPPSGGRLAVVACTPGEQHTLGALMIGEFLEGAGWEVLQLGAGLPAEDLLALVVDEQPDAVGLSTATPGMLPGAEQALALLGEADPRPLIVIGGQAWRDVPAERIRELGADARLPGPLELVDLLRRELPPLPE